ncbi:MAG: hypothetical protein HYW49_12455 [Deltaproteobacteria bacterium]|nr:hypothetical protein [Deltaproteobacteria bacterium]
MNENAKPRIKPLGLLDDGAAALGPEDREWAELTRFAAKQAAAPARAAVAGAALDRAAVAGAAGRAATAAGHALPAPKAIAKPPTIGQRLRAALPSKNIQTTRKGTRVFRDKKSLKQMMEEYNGRGSSLPPLKSSLARSPFVPAAGKPARRATPGDFRYDRVEVMEVPEVAARVLRPEEK